MSGSIFKRTAHLRAFVTDDEPALRKRVRSKIRMPRTVVTAPAAGPSRETPGTRRRRTAAAASEASATPQAATPRRRRAPAKTDAPAASDTPTDTTEDTAPESVIEEPATDTGEGDEQ
jgi:hypothetical protein